jgi:hypothetical protein
MTVDFVQKTAGTCETGYFCTRCDAAFLRLRQTPIKISLLLSGLTSTREINEICEESQVVLKRAEWVLRHCREFQGGHPYLVAPIAELCRFDDCLAPIIVPTCNEFGGRHLTPRSYPKGISL